MTVPTAILGFGWGATFGITVAMYTGFQNPVGVLIVGLSVGVPLATYGYLASPLLNSDKVVAQ